METLTAPTTVTEAELVRFQPRIPADLLKRVKKQAVEEDTTAELLTAKALDAYLKSKS